MWVAKCSKRSICPILSNGFDLHIFCNIPDKRRQTRSVAYTVELVLNKHQISGGGTYLDCYLRVVSIAVTNYLILGSYKRSPRAHSLSSSLYLLICLYMMCFEQTKYHIIICIYIEMVTWSKSLCSQNNYDFNFWKQCWSNCIFQHLQCYFNCNKSDSSLQIKTPSLKTKTKTKTRSQNQEDKDNKKLCLRFNITDVSA